MSLRVIQWSTGNVGHYALRHIIDHPGLELGGLWVHSPSKAGTDAEATKVAEKGAADADAAVKAAEAKKAEAVKRVADLGPKEVEGTFYSAPVVVKIAAPVEKK